MNVLSSAKNEEIQEVAQEKNHTSKPQEDSKSENAQEDSKSENAQEDSKSENDMLVKRQKLTCTSTGLKVTSIACLLFMSCLFIAGASFLHPDNYGSMKVKEPAAFWLCGALLFITIGSLDLLERIRKKESTGVSSVVAVSLSVFGGLLWFIGSIVLFSSTLNLRAFGALWIVGSLLHLYLTTFDLIALFRSEVAPIFRVVALQSSWLANLFFLAGAGAIIAFADRLNFCACELSNGAGLLIAAGVMYLLHTIFVILDVFNPNLIITVALSTPTKSPIPETDDVEKQEGN